LKEKLINGTYEECEELYEEIVTNIVLCENALARCQYVDNATELQSQKLSQLMSEKDEELKKLEAEVASLKEEYNKLNVNKQNREQYEVLVKLINEYPSREKTEKEISAIEGQINQLEEENEKINDKISNRTKQFQLLLFALNQLQTELDKEEKKDMDLSDK